MTSNIADIMIMKFPTEDSRRQQMIESGYNEDEFKLKFNEVSSFIKFPTHTHHHHYYTPNLSRWLLFQSLEKHIKKQVFVPFTQDEYMTVDKMSNKSSMRFVDTSVFDTSKTMILDKNSCHYSIGKKMDLPVSIGYFKDTNEINYKNQKIEYYLVEINENDRPEYVYNNNKNNVTNGFKIIWLSIFDIQIYQLFNKHCVLINQPNNLYTYDTYIRVANKLISDVYEQRIITKNTIFKNILNIMYGLCFVKSSNVNTTGLIDENSRQSKSGIIVQRTDHLLFPELYRCFLGLYSKAKYMHACKIKILLDNNIRIYRIVSDDVTCDRTNLLDEFISDKAGYYKVNIGYIKLKETKENFIGNGHYDNTLRFIRA